MMCRKAATSELLAIHAGKDGDTGGEGGQWLPQAGDRVLVLSLGGVEATVCAVTD